MSQGSTPALGASSALLPAMQDTKDTVSWTSALDTLTITHLPQTQRAIDSLFERMYVMDRPDRSTYSLANDADSCSIYDALEKAEKQLESLAHFLTTSGLAGLPVNKDRELTLDDMAMTSRRLFEQRARMSEATALVSSIFSPL